MDPYNTADALGVPARATAPQFTPAVDAANPYAAPSARLAEPAADGELVLASRMARLGAALIDAFIFVVPAMLSALMIPNLGLNEAGDITGLSNSVIALYGLAALGFMAYQLVLLHRHGQTLGKKLVGVRIVRRDGSRATLGRIVGLRIAVPGVIGWIPLLGPLFGLANVLFIFGDDKRCLHDRFADTIVVDA